AHRGPRGLGVVAGTSGADGEGARASRPGDDAMRRVLLCTAVVAAIGLGACGGDGPAVSGRAARQLDPEVAPLPRAVEARDAPAPGGALTTLRTSVDRFERSGDVSEQRAVEILAAARAVETQLVSITTTTTTTSPPPTVGDRGRGQGGDNGENNGN